MNKILFLLTILFLVGCKPENNIPIKVSLNENWQFKGSDTLNWNSATVPGNIHSDLLNNKLIKHPFIGNNEEELQWISDTNWHYKTHFKVDKQTLEKKHIELHLEGLDTYASVFLNGLLILKTNNAFRLFQIDIKPFLKAENDLRIEFEKTAVFEEREKTKLDYTLPEGNRIYTRKAQFQYGWDWGPKLNTSGIWKAISIKAWDDYKIVGVDIIQNELTDSIANLTLKIEERNSLHKNLKYEVYINNSSTVSLPKSENSEIPLIIKNPKKWWPHNLGEPYLYNFKIVVKEGENILDSISIKKGLRTIELVTEKDSIGESFYFKVNNVPMYAKGANYIPQNSMQNKVTNAHYEKLLSDVVESNMNMLRVWGGGIYENNIFYELCDEKGILVWQDFMFACAMYPGDTAFLKNIAEEAKQHVKRLRNHASIALWCGNNENSEGWKRWGWQANRTEKEKEEIWSDYAAVFDSILPNIVAQFSTTNYWESSPKFGRGNPKYEFEGDAHDWWVWHDAAPFEHFQERVPRFMSEFGFQSFPSYEVLKYINQSDSISLKTEAIKSHQKHKRGFQLIDEYMRRDYKTPINDEDYVYVSQLLQAKGIVMGIEAQRRAKPHNMGTLFWQLNDCWPSISWSSIDYFGNWKALQYKVKNAFENLLISSKVDDNILRTYIINDSYNRLTGNLKLKIFDFYGKEIWSDSKKITVLENSSKQFYNLPLENFNQKSTFLVTEFNGEKSMCYFEKPKNLKLLKGEIQQTITKVDTGFLVTLKSAVLQKDVFLYTKHKGHFSTNFFELLPNETKTVFFKTKTTVLDDLQFKTLNKLNLTL